MVYESNVSCWVRRANKRHKDHPVDLAVASFMAEMRLSADLSELAKTPLLLGLLLYLKSSAIPLPNSRYRAYWLLVEHLISVHPIVRRRAAMVKAEDSDMTPEDARTVFASLAYHLQSQLPEGLIERGEAEDDISQFLRDDELGFGLAQAEARRQARILLAFGEQSLGLLVERGPQELGFLHRSFQEYLRAAEHVARGPFAAQSAFVKLHCTEAIWQEVLLSLLHLTKRPGRSERTRRRDQRRGEFGFRPVYHATDTLRGRRWRFPMSGDIGKESLQRHHRRN